MQTAYAKQMSSQIQSDLVPIMLKLAIIGGKEAMKHYGKIDTVMTKADESPLTAADLAVDEIIVSGLAEACPQIPVITEERADNHASDLTSGRFFLVDPIDGTKEFINGRDEFTINIALIEDGQPIAGVVCAPAINRAFWGEVGRGASQSTADVGATAAPSCARTCNNQALTVVASRSHRTPETDAFIEANKVAELKSAGSSLKFCLLACGEADLYPRFGPTMEWDTAAGHAVLAAAGGAVHQIDNSPLTYGKPGYKNPWFIAKTPNCEYST